MNVKSMKKGFTLTELIIVIVIIGILAGVLIPTFINVVNKANKAADLSLIRNLNEALVLDKYDNGEHKHMTAALEAVEEYGFEVEKIDAKVSKNKILWDSKNDVFCYLVGEDTLEYYPNSVSKEIDLDDPKEVYLLWIIDDEVNSKFSTYLYGYTDTTDEEHPLIANGVGLDTGEYGVKFVKYVNSSTTAKDVVIRTNSANTTLTINAPSDIVKHYDAVGSLNIIAVANASYHEFGQVAFAEIATGRIVLEENSEVEHIHLNTSVVKINNEDVVVFNNITVAKAESVEMPEFSRDPIEIDEEKGTLVVALQAGTEEITESTELDYVWLTAVGIYEQVTVSDSKDDAKNNYAATSTTASQEQKTAAQQIANNITFEAAGEDYKVTAKTTDGGATWTYEVVDQNGTVSEDYSAEKHNSENTVEVKTSGENPEVVDTTTENGLNKESKDNLKDDLVITAKADEQIGEQLLGIKTVSINNESIDVYLPVNTSDGSLDLDDIKSSTLVPFNFNFAGGVSFIAPESINEEWNNATADFVISFNKDIVPISSFNYNYNEVEHTVNGENVSILPVIGVGKFGNNATSFWEKYKNMWLPCPITSDGYKANEEIALLQDVFASVGFSGVSVNCEELVNCIKEFSCGLVFLQDIGEVTITVKLVVTNNNTKYVVGSQEFTFNSSDYVTTCPIGTYPAE